MKNGKALALSGMVLSAWLLVGCDNSSGSSMTDPVAEYSRDYVNVDYTGVNRVVYYDFKTGVKTEEAGSWDLAFDGSLSIIANSGHYGRGVAVYKTEYVDFSQDFNALSESASFTPTYSDANPIGRSWMDMSSMPPKFPGYVYLVRTESRDVYKVQFVGGGMGGTVQMKIGTPSATEAEAKTFGPAGEYDRTYIDLATSSAVFPAPKKSDWDVKFGRTEFPMGAENTGGRSSILLNTAAGVSGAVVEGEAIDQVLNIAGVEWISDPHAIGHSWYIFDHDTRRFSVAENTNLIKRADGTITKFQIGSFYGPDGEQFHSVFEYLNGDESGSFDK